MAMMPLPPCTTSSTSRTSDGASTVCWLEFSQVGIGLGRSTLVEFHCLIPCGFWKAWHRKKWLCYGFIFKTLPTNSLARYNAGTTGFFKAGQPFCGGYRIVWVSVQGDLDFFAASLGLPRWSLAEGGCPVCRCKAFGELTWKKFYPPEHVTNMEWMPHEWPDWEGKSKCPLFEAIGVTACSVMLDWMHVKYLGNDQYVYASILLCFVVLPQAPLQNLVHLGRDERTIPFLEHHSPIPLLRQAHNVCSKEWTTQATGKSCRSPSLAQSDSPTVAETLQRTHCCPQTDSSPPQIELKD